MAAISCVIGGSHPADIVVNLDLLTYAGNLRNLADLEEGPHYRFVCGDIADADFVAKVGGSAGRYGRAFCRRIPR